MPQFFNIIANTINGEIQEFPKVIELECGKAFGVGEAIIRDYDDNFCIVNKRVFLINYGKNTFGTTQVANKQEWWRYVNAFCYQPAAFLVNGCDATINGDILIL